MKNRIPQSYMIPQYRTLKLKLPKYRVKKAQYLNTVNLHVPLNHWISRTKNNNKIITMVLKALNVPVDTRSFSLCWRPFEN